jgi:pimeloyl-ACP methyl ester carboxylesterase
MSGGWGPRTAHLLPEGANVAYAHAPELPGAMFRDPESAGARVMFARAEDEEARVTAQVGLTWAMGATGKFIWPIRDKGLKKRIHRVKAPTLLIWGAEDRLVPPI